MRGSTEEHDRRRRRLPFVLPLVALLVGAGLTTLLDELLEHDRPLRGTAVSAAPAPQREAVPQVQVVTPQPQGARAEAVSAASVAGADNAGTAALPPLVVTSAVDTEVGPGSPATLTVSLRNPSAHGVRITGLAARVVSVAQRGSGACQPGWYRIASYAGDLALPARATRDVRLAVVFVDLPDVDQDGCKGAAYSFRYTVQAVAA